MRMTARLMLATRDPRLMFQPARYALGTDVVQHIRSDDEQNRKIVGHEIPP